MPRYTGSSLRTQDETLVPRGKPLAQWRAPPENIHQNFAKFNLAGGEGGIGCLGWEVPGSFGYKSSIAVHGSSYATAPTNPDRLCQDDPRGEPYSGEAISDHQRSAAAGRTLSRWNAMADLPLDHRRAQRSCGAAGAQRFVSVQEPSAPRHFSPIAVPGPSGFRRAGAASWVPAGRSVGLPMPPPEMPSRRHPAA